MATVPFVCGRGRGPESGKIWWLKEVENLTEKKYHRHWTSCVARKPEGAFAQISAIFGVPLEFVPASRERVVPTQWQVRTVSSWRLQIESKKVIPVQAPQYRQYAVISDFLNLAHLSVREEAALATNWIKDRPEGLKLQNLALAISACGSPSTSFFCRMCTSSAVCYFRAPSVAILTSLRPAVDPLLGCSSGKPRSRPIGVRVCLVAQFDFLSTAFDPREWTMVVFWKEDSGRQLRLNTPENGGGDETSSPSITTKIYLPLLILMFL